MKRSKVTTNLTPGQIDEIKGAFKRLKRLKRRPFEADRLLSEVPRLLRAAINRQLDIEGLHEVAALRGRAAMARDFRDLEQAAASLAEVIRRRRPTVWRAFGGPDTGEFATVFDSFHSQLLGVVTQFRSRRWPRVPRGEHRRYDERELLAGLAKLFLDQGLPLSTSPNGLFSSVAVVLHPAEPRPVTIRHHLLAKAVFSARKSYRPRITAFGVS